MAASVTLKSATPHRVSFLVEGDGTATHTITSAVLLAAMVPGPLYNAWNATYDDQAAMRAALLEGRGRISFRDRALPVDTTGEVNRAAADVDADAVTATKAELNLQLSDTDGHDFYLDIEYSHSIVD